VCHTRLCDDLFGLLHVCLLCLLYLLTLLFFFFTSTAAAAIYPLSLHDALPILELGALRPVGFFTWNARSFSERWARRAGMEKLRDRKSTRLNSSHGSISYAVFCLKKKKTNTTTHQNSNAPTLRNTIVSTNSEQS